MTKFEDWSDLKKRWGLKSFEILEYLGKGLQPYTENGVKFSCPKKYNQAYINKTEDCNKADQEVKHNTKKVQNTDVVKKYLNEVESLAETHYYGNFNKDKPDIISKYQKFNDQYQKIFDIWKLYRACL